MLKCCVCRAEARAADLHPLPDAGAGEGVPLQPLSHAQEADRDRACAVPHREADQDLVPEQEDEVEEGEQIQVRRPRPGGFSRLKLRWVLLPIQRVYSDLMMWKLQTEAKYLLKALTAFYGFQKYLPVCKNNYLASDKNIQVYPQLVEPPTTNVMMEKFCKPPWLLPLQSVTWFLIFSINIFQIRRFFHFVTSTPTHARLYRIKIIYVLSTTLDWKNSWYFSFVSPWLLAWWVTFQLWAGQH